MATCDYTGINIQATEDVGDFTITSVPDDRSNDGSPVLWVYLYTM